MEYTSQSAQRGRSARSNYGDSLVSWLEGEGFGNNRYLKSVFQSNADDQTKYLSAMAFYDGLGGKNGGQKANPEDEVVHLIPHETSDGSFQYVNRMTGKVEVSVGRMPSGLFTYYGPVKWITRLGGRGELSGLRDSMADGKYFNKG